MTQFAFQASERLSTVSKEVEKSIETVKLVQLELLEIQSKFIKNLKIQSDDDASPENEED